MSTAYLLLGSNMGNRAAWLDAALSAIAEQVGSLVALSYRYETAAWGNTDQAPFLNQAVALDTILDPSTLLDGLLNIEQSLGRQRLQYWGARTIDIDILGYDNRLVATDRLHIPHRWLHARRFALLPLHDIAPQWIHPIWQQSIAQLLLQCPDPLPCKRIVELTIAIQTEQ
ncbi:MAG: 2-amino-4-hydroxy-6-hydroxymethyldihydropteridine diphosphokinase [Chitinophagales bacterium]|nr:2-amino-4-hydroxy-6-hydroxymethyldihydropteridine diphosphokinase [Chitinophagales bacterium]